MANERTEQQWRLWLEYLLAKADGDEITATQKLKELLEVKP